MVESIIGWVIFLGTIFIIGSCAKSGLEWQAKCVKSCSPYRVAYININKNLCGCETNIEMREPK